MGGESTPSSLQSSQEKPVEEGPALVSTPAAVSPREDIPAWKWKASLVVFMLTTVINGYDVSNVANIQPRLYEAFGNIALLPWIGLSYSLASFAVLALSRKILYCFNMRWIYIVNVVIFMVGAAVAGSAQNMSSVIVGRIIMGVSGAIVYQSNLTFVAVFASPTETPRLFGLLSAVWAIGLVVGGPIGSALASNPSTTWRWAFYMNLPWVGFSLLLALFCIPHKHLGPDIPIPQRLAKIDPIGVLLNMASPVLFAVALEFSGAVWSWSSGSTIAVWILFGLTTIAWFLQQTLCIFTTPTERSIPIHLIKRLDLLPLWVASGCAGASYAVTLYYTPLFFAFARGHSAIQQTIRLLPFILVFIVVVMLVGGSLPILGRYAIIYLIAGLTTVSGAAAMAGTMSSPTVSESVIMGLEALIGIGLGCSFQHGVGISNVILAKSPQARVDSAILFNMSQMGAIVIALSVAGSIFQNVGFELLSGALAGEGFSDEELREALAGVSSVVWASRDAGVIERGVEAVSTVIAREFYLVVAGGAICLVCAAGMSWGKLDYGRGGKKSESEAEGGVGAEAQAGSD
ncbi:major facilitator superfamily domain-containing protein [Aspergillus californicus]